MEMERDVHDGDPSPEMNVRAAERALGPQKLWAEHLTSLAVWPAALLTAGLTLVAHYERAFPTTFGLVLGVLVAALLGYAAGGRMPRALAHARRVPLVVLAVAAGGLGACIGAVSMGAAVLASPLLSHPETWVLGGASFGLVYAALLLIPSVLARLGRVSSSLFVVVRGAAMLAAGAYALAIA